MSQNIQAIDVHGPIVLEVETSYYTFDRNSRDSEIFRVLIFVSSM
jgi:hypothetical protein